MCAFNDATCPKCGEHFGWRGKITDKPPCPNCDWQQDRKILEKIEKQIEEDRRLLDAEFELRRKRGAE